MAHFEDLTSNTYFERWEDVLVSIGWLDAEHEFRHGRVSADFFHALVLLLVEPWQPAVFPGRGKCARCRFSGGPGVVSFGGTKITVGSNNLFVPGVDRKVFVAPSLIAHYIDAHEYSPPEDFQTAVLACPEMGSLAYRKALHERGVRTSPPAS